MKSLVLGRVEADTAAHLRCGRPVFCVLQIGSVSGSLHMGMGVRYTAGSSVWSVALPFPHAPCQGYSSNCCPLVRLPAAQPFLGSAADSGHLVFLLRDLKWFPIIVRLKFLPFSRILRAV